uniref:Uncharacterized protein n=1 Tax=Lactuca sativa TaxID=4236 RepID=A0A9R1X2V0_LACSA|nr:hypothetical protein LSAT_V11C700367180 [Lactuca sativa]
MHNYNSSSAAVSSISTRISILPPQSPSIIYSTVTPGIIKIYMAGILDKRIMSLLVPSDNNIWWVFYLFVGVIDFSLFMLGLAALTKFVAFLMITS